jgi:hypothetical protein
MVWLRGGVNIGASLPTTKVAFSNEPVARFGLPLIEGNLSVEIRIP